MSILIATSHPAHRQQLIDAISARLPDVGTIEAKTGDELFRLVATDRVELVILDLRLPAEGGVPVLRRLKQRAPALPVIIFDAYPDQYYSVASRKAGAVGYLSPFVSSHELGTALRTVLSGGVYFSADSRPSDI